MNTFHKTSPGAARVASPPSATVWGLGLMALAAIIFLELGGPLAAAPPTLAPAEKRPARRVLDVAIQMPNGVLLGQVLPAVGKRPDKTVADLQVLLLENGRPAAETRTDRQGRFRVGNLSGGVYQVVVNGAAGPAVRRFRAWAPSTAPPNAAVTVEVPLKETLVRGQGPFPILSFPQAAAIVGVAAGAVAAPVIYHNSRQNNRAPVSP